MTLPPFTLLRPTTVDEAVHELTEDKVPYCGGTELLLAMRAGLYRPTALVDVKRLPELSGVRIAAGELVIGAAERHMDLATNPEVNHRLPMLAGMERAVGNARVRAQGSIGGNLCFAEPKSDVATALVALDAAVTLVSPDGDRRVSVEDFIAGPYFAAREPDELLVDVRVRLSDDRRAVYVKYQTMERPTVGVALVHHPGRGRYRLVIGAAGETPMTWNFAAPDEIDPAEVAAQTDPVADLTGSVRYKKHVTAVYIRRALNELAGAS